MPEGHTLHRIAHTFDQLFVGSRVAVTSPQGRFEYGAKLLDGLTVEESFAVGKHQFVRFSDNSYLHVHLGIYGAWDITLADGTGTAERLGQTGEYSLGAPRRKLEVPTDFPPPPRGAVRVRILSSHVCADLRGPTVCEVLTAPEVAAKLAQLGPDPLVEPGGAERFYELASRKRVPIAQVLMDQSVIAGIGNIYRAEMLFRAQLDPFVPANEVAREQYAQLWEDWSLLLKRGVADGVMITRDLTGDEHEEALVNKDVRHFVYGRAGLPCRVCGTPVALTEMQKRKLYWCPGCQVLRSEKSVP